MNSNIKHIVVCGPELASDLTEHFALRKEYNKPFYTVLFFPEASYSGSGVINTVHEIVELGKSSIIYTRYPHVLQAFSEAIAEGMLNCSELKILLHQINDDGVLEVSEHSMTSEGVMNSGWPFGILQ